MVAQLLVQAATRRLAYFKPGLEIVFHFCRHEFAQWVIRVSCRSKLSFIFNYIDY